MLRIVYPDKHGNSFLDTGPFARKGKVYMGIHTCIPDVASRWRHHRSILFLANKLVTDKTVRTLEGTLMLYGKGGTAGDAVRVNRAVRINRQGLTVSNDRFLRMSL